MLGRMSMPDPTTVSAHPATLLTGQRVLLTQADTFMGPVLAEVFRRQGATVIADTRPLTDPAAAAAAVADAGQVDTLLIHLAVPAPATAAQAITEGEWRHMFVHMVDPMPRLVAAVLPQMLARKAGRILLMGSAAALRGQKRTGSYSAARGAQLAYMQSVALELAPQGIQFNAIAQNFVENPTYFPPAVQANPRFQDRLQREVPLGRLVGAEEDALFAAYLCSPAAACFVGQVFPVSGGWALK